MDSQALSASSRSPSTWAMYMAALKVRLCWSPECAFLPDLNLPLGLIASPLLVIGATGGTGAGGDIASVSTPPASSVPRESSSSVFFPSKPWPLPSLLCPHLLQLGRWRAISIVCLLLFEAIAMPSPRRTHLSLVSPLLSMRWTEAARAYDIGSSISIGSGVVGACEHFIRSRSTKLHCPLPFPTAIAHCNFCNTAKAAV